MDSRARSVWTARSAKKGLEELLPRFGSALEEKAGGLGQLTELLGGGAEGLGGKIGKLFS